jgi:hypothetical protein
VKLTQRSYKVLISMKNEEMKNWSAHRSVIFHSSSSFLIKKYAMAPTQRQTNEPDRGGSPYRTTEGKMVEYR